MSRIEWASMPAGVHAVAHIGADGEVVITLSDTLKARREALAVMVSAAQEAGWNVEAPPVSLA